MSRPVACDDERSSPTRSDLGWCVEGHRSSAANQEWSEGPTAVRKQAVAGLMGAGTGSDERRLPTGQRSERARPGAGRGARRHGQRGRLGGRGLV